METLRFHCHRSNPCVQFFLPGTKPARVEAAAAAEAVAAVAAAAGPGSRPLLTDPLLQLAVLAVGGGAARLLAEAGSCLASSFAGAEAEAIGSGLLRRPRGRAAQARQSADVCLSLYLFAGIPRNAAKQYKQQKNTKHYGMTFSKKYEGPRTNQQINVPTIRCLDL